jgi:hypothetical protein
MNIESSRYVLSTLVQSEATVLAIVISLNIIFIQLAASHSKRLVSRFADSTEVKLYLVIYIVSIIYTLLVLAEIGRPIGVTSNFLNDTYVIRHDFPLISSGISYIENSFPNINNHILLSLYLGIFSFLILPKYLKLIIYFVEPSAIINRLVNRISKQSILSVAGHRVADSGRDPIQPIIDTIRHSWLVDYDFESARDGLKTLRDSINNIILYETPETFSLTDQRHLMKHVCSHYFGICVLAIKREEKSIVSEVLYDLESLGINAANQSLEQAVFTLLLSLSDLVRIADSEEHLDFIEWIGLSFCEIGKASAARFLDTEVKITINHSIQLLKI